MQKTRKSMVKRFKVTGTGKIMRRTPGRRHLMTAKSSHQIRSSRADKPVYAGFHKAIRASMPSAF